MQQRNLSTREPDMVRCRSLYTISEYLRKQVRHLGIWTTVNSAKTLWMAVEMIGEQAMTFPGLCSVCVTVKVVGGASILSYKEADVKRQLVEMLEQHGLSIGTDRSSSL